MRQAPPVGVGCSGGLPWRAAQSLLMAAAASALSAWGFQQVDRPAAWGLPVAVGVALLAWWRLRPRVVQLHWDGTGWSADGAAGRVDLMLDAGPLMLLRWQPPAGRARWIAVCRGEAGRAWPALRAALYSPAVSTTPDPNAPE